MAKSILIKNASIVNENKTFLGDVLIENERIAKIASSKIANSFRQLILKDGCSDTGCGLKIFDKEHHPVGTLKIQLQFAIRLQ